MKVMERRPFAAKPRGRRCRSWIGVPPTQQPTTRLTIRLAPDGVGRHSTLFGYVVLEASVARRSSVRPRDDEDGEAWSTWSQAFGAGDRGWGHDLRCGIDEQRKHLAHLSVVCTGSAGRCRPARPLAVARPGRTSATRFVVGLADLRRDRRDFSRTAWWWPRLDEASCCSAPSRATSGVRHEVEGEAGAGAGRPGLRRRQLSSRRLLETPSAWPGRR